MIRWLCLSCLVTCGCLADQPQEMDDRSAAEAPRPAERAPGAAARTELGYPATQRQLTHLVDPGGVTWTRHGHMVAMGYLPVDTARKGRVVCDLHESKDGTMLPKVVTRMTGNVAHGWTQRGPRSSVWAVPLFLERPVPDSRMVFARCAVDGLPNDDSRTEVIWGIRPPQLPDVALESVELFDCATEGPPQQGKPTCIRVKHAYPKALHGPQTSNLELVVSCELDGPSAERIQLTLPLDEVYERHSGTAYPHGRRGMAEAKLLDVVAAATQRARVSAGQTAKVVLKAGTYDVHCATDAAGTVDESNETNNRIGASQVVVPPIDPSVFRLKLRSIELAERVPPRQPSRYAGGENGIRVEPEPVDVLVLAVENASPFAVNEVVVHCDIGGATYSGAIPGGEMAPGIARAYLTIPAQPAGQIAVDCQAEIVSPTVRAPATELKARVAVPG